MSRTKKSRGTHEEGDHTATIDAFWIQSIGKWLPGTWAEAPIADRAVKSDDAIVDFSPWWNRIRMVLPCPLKNLVSFEELGMHFWRRSLRQSFVRYLTGRYGHNWLEECTRRSEVGDLAEPSAKRRRRVVSLNEPHTKEGVRKTEKTKDGEEDGEAETGRETLSPAEVWELRQDLEKGRAILSQVLRSKFLVGVDLWFVPLFLAMEWA